MAKDKKKSAKKDAAEKKQKIIPRQVAGVKIPRGMRAAGDKVIRAAENAPLGEIAAVALMAAATALRDKPKHKGEGEDQRSRRSETAVVIKLAALEGLRQLADALADRHKHKQDSPGPR